LCYRQGYYDEGYDYKHDYCDKCQKDYEFCQCRKYKDEGALVEKVVCSKEVHKKAEFLLPAAVGTNPLLDIVLGLLGGVVNVRVTPDYTGIKSEATVIHDEVINFGYIPATLDVEGTILDIVDLRIPIQIFFQEHTPCPGARPGDKVIETPPVVDAFLNEPLLATGTEGTTLNLLLFKAVIRTHITVVRQGIKKNGKVCDLEPDRCESGPVRINSPLNMTPNTTALPIAGAGGTAPANNNTGQ
jgi:hypothetical protein